jgi:hypothetical protein
MLFFLTLVLNLQLSMKPTNACDDLMSAIEKARYYLQILNQKCNLKELRDNLDKERDRCAIHFCPEYESCVALDNQCRDLELGLAIIPECDALPSPQNHQCYQTRKAEVCGQADKVCGEQWLCAMPYCENDRQVRDAQERVLVCQSEVQAAQDDLNTAIAAYERSCAEGAVVDIFTH